jgi:hypothetical protein
MAALLHNQTLSVAATTNFPVTSTPLPVPANQPPQWDAVAIYGFVFGLLAVLLAVPGTYLAFVALKRHREHEAVQCEFRSTF